MLVLSRKVGEKLVIGDNVTIIVNRVAGNRVTIGIDAPDEVRVIRGELKPLAQQFRAPAEPALAWTSGGYKASDDTEEVSLPRLAK
jgi:carbon storage regulator